MNKLFKITMIVLMLIGISLSISNFFCVELRAVENNGTWVDDVARVCIAPGNECSTFGYEFFPDN